MCGIYGIIHRDDLIDRRRLAFQRDKLAHRGPDDCAIWVSPDERCGFAHRRLSILDLSTAGRQPMSSADGRYIIVFNGEIYNHRELRVELARAGHVFLTGTDTEVLLAAWSEWAEKCLSRLNGMFAFALFDSGEDRNSPIVFLARDRVGKKPLYFTFNSERLEFASELKAISGRGALNLRALNFYLSMGFVPGGHCISSGVQKLPAAHVARVDLREFSLKSWRYWQLPENQPNSTDDVETLADEACDLLTQSTNIRMVADVPVGILLSGGLDSSLIVAAAARQTGHLLQTFTVTQPGSKLDESRHAKLVSAHFGTTHHELSILDSGLAVLDELAPFIDEPLADSSLIPTYLISQLTRKHVTVALSGDGGDELFGGYAHYSTNLLDEKRLDWAPIQLLQIVGAAASRLPAGFKGRNRIAALQSGPSLQRAMGSNFFDVQLRRKILTESAIAELGIEMGAPENGLVESLQVGSDSVDRMTRTDFHTVLADGYLVKVDRASMAVSLEMRSPFLDHRLVEFSFGRIPSKWKVLGAETRRLERVIARRWLPPTLDMKRKQGFSISMEAWLRKVPRTWHESWLDRLPSQINRDFAFKLVKGLHSGRSNGSRIFALAMLSLSNARLNKE